MRFVPNQASNRALILSTLIQRKRRKLGSSLATFASSANPQSLDWCKSLATGTYEIHGEFERSFCLEDSIFAASAEAGLLLRWDDRRFHAVRDHIWMEESSRISEYLKSTLEAINISRSFRKTLPSTVIINIIRMATQDDILEDIVIGKIVDWGMEGPRLANASIRQTLFHVLGCCDCEVETVTCI